jgi:hypothetical protein
VTIRYARQDIQAEFHSPGYALIDVSAIQRWERVF